MYRYGEQLGRVERYLKRISTPSVNREDYEDSLWSFFQNCWHLRDWIQNDSGIPQSKRDAVKKAVRQSEILAVCECLANRTKHSVLDRPHRSNASVQGGISLRIEDSIADSESDSATIVLDYVVEIEREPSRRALALAEDAVREWKKILQANVL